VVVTDKLGVVKEVPVPSNVPADNASYQEIVPALAVAPNVKVPVPHLLAGVVPVIVGVVFTVAITAVRGEEVQPALVAST
jgi:hypothetical protein